MDLGATIGEGAPGSPGLNAPWNPSQEPHREEFFEPTLYIYDAYPGGIGLSEPLFRMHDALLARTRELIADCQCEKGCPSCVGPVGETSERAKEAALEILKRLLESHGGLQEGFAGHPDLPGKTSVH